MLIEFSCPACKTQLSVEDKVAGRKVDCPKCKELIIIPVSAQDLSKEDQSLPDSNVLCSVLPYRSEMLSKHNKLLEAIEEIKLRNERIRELESSSLRIQKELWAIEVEFEQRNKAYEQSETEKRELKKKLNQGGIPAGGTTTDEIKALQCEIDLAQKQIATLEKELKVASDTSADAINQKSKAETDKREEQIQHLEKELKEVDKINMALKAEVSSLTVGINQRDAIANQAYQQIQQVLNAQEVIRALSKGNANQLKVLETQNEDLKVVTNEAVNLSKQIKDAKDTIGRNVEAPTETGASEKPTSAREETLANTVKELNEALSQAQHAENKAKKRIADLQDKYKSLENKVENDKDSNERLAKITTSFTALEKEHLSLEKKHETLLEEKDELQAASDRLKNLASLEAENMEYVAKIAYQENELKRLHAELEALETGLPAGTNGAAKVKPPVKAGSITSDVNKDLQTLHDRLSKLEITSDELATENARLKNTVRTLTENLKAQWKKRDAKVHVK